MNLAQNLELGIGRESAPRSRLVSVTRFFNAFVVLFALTCFASAQSDSPTPLAWSPNKVVRALAESDGRLYVAGDFDRIAPITGSVAVLDKVAGEVQTSSSFPRIGGTVNAIAPDGSGGWYVGGIFDRVGSAAARNLAHILADGSVDSRWLPAANGAVHALVVSGNRVFIGGEFTKIRKKKRAYLAALDAQTGKVLSWSADTDVRVTALAVHGRRLFVGGWFANIRSVRRNGLAAVSTDTAALEAWNPDPDALARINEIVVGDNEVYFAGTFLKAGGRSRNCIAAADIGSGAVTDFNANSRRDFPELTALALGSGVLYVGGYFDDLGGEDQYNIAALDARTGRARPWSAVYYSRVTALAVDSGIVYAGGYGTATETTAIAFDAATGDTVEWNAHSNGNIQAFAVTDDAIALAGTFTMAGGVARSGLAALDSRTGEPLLDWHPDITDGSDVGHVTALAVRGSSVYIGGRFYRVNGQARPGLAELDATTGALKSLEIGLGGSVNALVIDGSTLYVGGTFSHVSPANVRRNGLAAIDLERGTLTDFAPTGGDESSADVRAIAVDGDTVFIGGKFQYVGGLQRYNIAAVNRQTGLVTDWDAGFDREGGFNTLAVVGQTVFAGGGFRLVAGDGVRYAVALDKSTGLANDWNPNLNGAITDLVVRGQTVYLAGGFRDYPPDGVRTGLCAVDATTGALLSWNPDPDDGVIAVLATSDRLIAIGWFTKFKEEAAVANYVVTFELEPLRQ